MLKPKHLERGDTVAIVSLSSGILGEPWAIHKLEIARERLENDFDVKVKVMPNALKGVEYLDAHPEARAQDLTPSAGMIRSASCLISILMSYGIIRKSLPVFPTRRAITS